jgi:hypothetical protein
MALNDAAKNAMLDHFGTLASYVSLHTADPGSGGAAEVTGGTPAYARKTVTWNAATGANLDNNANPVFDVPGSTTVTHCGLWSAATGGTFYGGFALSANEIFGGQGTYTFTDIDVTLT